MDKLRVGLVGLWFERGNAYLTAGLREMLLPEMDPFIYARTGYIVSHQGREKHMEHGGRWNVPNVTRLPEYDIDPSLCADWIEQNGISVVLWNEEYNHALVRRVKGLLKERGYLSPSGKECLQVAYLDWVGPDSWVKELKDTYHFLTCATARTQSMIAHQGLKAHKFKWSVNLDLFRPSQEDPPYLFFHNAGWVGTNFRKGSIAVLRAWEKAFPKGYAAPEAFVCVGPSLLIHTQKPLREWPSGCQKVIQGDSRIHVHEGTVTAPGLYNKGWVYLGPSLLEGLGLTFPEALASGLPIITTDAPPMNEHGDSITCTRVRVASTKARGDGCAFLENSVDITQLADVLKSWTLREVSWLRDIQISARDCAEAKYNRKRNAPDFQAMLKGFLDV